MNKYLLVFSLILSSGAYSSDWGGKKAVIDYMYVYTNTLIVVQGDNYAGAANCKDDTKWGLYWSSFDEATAQRIYSTLLAAYISKTPIHPIFDSAGCGPEGQKKFNGNFVL